MQNKNIHRLPHIFLNNVVYYVTGATLYRKSLFNSKEKMQAYTSILRELVEIYAIKLYAWVLLENHYHLLFQLPAANSLTPFIRKLHSKTAVMVNRIDNIRGRKIWYQYWDHCIRNEADFYKHFNYIHQNPIKHGKVKNLDGLEEYKFSSYKDWCAKKGKEWLLSCFERYPIIDFVEKSES